MARRDRGGVRSRLPEVDRTVFAMLLAGILIVLVIVLPRVYPAARLGPQCTDLAAPIGGNNRSVLALAGDDEQDLSLELRMPDRVVSTSGAVEVNLTFVNQDIGPVILYLQDTAPPLTRLDGDVGISFEIRRVGTDQPLADNATLRTAPGVYPSENLHLLGSRSRCTQSYTFPADQLAALGLQPGEYRIRAYYANPSSGTLPQPAGGVAPTATPAYTDQGVWVGQVSSEEILFTVVSPGAADVPAG